MTDNLSTNEERITSVLEKAPVVALPPGFASRVMANLPARPPVELVRRSHFGRSALLGSAFLLCALLVISLRSAEHGSVAGTLVEWTAFTQLAGIVLWLGLRSKELRS